MTDADWQRELLTQPLDLGFSPLIDQIPEIMGAKDVSFALDHKQGMPELSILSIDALGNLPPEQLT